MRHRLLLVALTGLLTCLAAAQTQTPQSGTNLPAESLADRSPSANVRTGAVQQRAPGNIIQQALARHRGLINDRVTAARIGQNSTPAPVNTPGDAGTPSSSPSTPGGSNILGNLLNSGLLGQLGGANLTNLLGNLTNNTTPAGSNGSGGGSTANNPNIPSNITPEVIALLQSFGIDINDVFPPPDSAGRQQARPADDAGLRAQQQQPAGGNNSDRPKFLTRLVDSLLSTVFNALVLGVQTQAFIDAIKERLRPLFGLSNPASNNAGAMRWRILPLRRLAWPAGPRSPLA